MVYRILAAAVTVFFFFGCGSGNTPEGPPSVVSDSLGDGSSVSISPSIIFTFNKDIDDVRTSAANVTLYDSNSTRIVGSVAVSGERLTFSPSTQLDYDSNYSIVVSGVLDLTATAMKTSYRRTFTTTEFVQAIAPADAEGNVSLFSDITVTFGSQIDATSLSATVSNITFTASSTDNKTFTLSPDGGTNFDSNYSGLLPSTSYTVTISQAQDIYDNNLSSAVTATFSTVPPDVIAPVVLATSPSDGGTAIATDVNISFTFDEDIIAPSSSQVSMVDDSLGNVAFSTAYDEDTRIVTLSPAATLDYATGYTITLSSVSDLFGNTMSDTLSFTTSTILLSTFPGDGGSGVPIDSVITAVFEGEINSSAALFTLKDSGGAAVSGATSFGTSTARFTPTADLSFSTTYSATITGVRDSNGNLLGDQSWSFTTKDDDVAPQLLSVTPADQATGVATATNISALYDETLGETATLILQDSDGISVKGTLSYAGNSVLFDPTASLQSGESYTVYLSGVTDAGGNKATVQLWTFEVQ